MVHSFNVKDACQYTLSAEKRVTRYGARKFSYGSNWKNNGGAERGYQTTQQNNRGAAAINKNSEGSFNVEKTHKGKGIVSYSGQNNFGSSSIKRGSNSQV